MWNNSSNYYLTLCSSEIQRGLDPKGATYRGESAGALLWCKGTNDTYEQVTCLCQPSLYI